MRNELDGVEESIGVMGSESERTCVGCRQQAEPHELERFIFVEGQGLIFDLRQKAPGRGAYVHAQPQCLEQAARRGGFSRGFKRSISEVAVEQLLNDVKEGVWRRLHESLQSAVRAGQAQVGETRVKEAMGANAVRLLLVARDAGESTRKKYVSNADRKSIATATELPGAVLATVAGKEFVAVMVITSDDFAARVKRDIVKLGCLGAFEG